jgi:hypothetical protein
LLFANGCGQGAESDRLPREALGEYLEYRAVDSVEPKFVNLIELQGGKRVLELNLAHAGH